MMARVDYAIETVRVPAGPANLYSASLSAGQWVTGLADLTASFSRWLDERTEDERIWPAFDRFIREALLDVVGATRIRLFRVVDGGRGLRPLTEEPDASSAGTVPTGLMDHVLATGRRYVRGDWSHGALVDQLAAESQERAPWAGARDPSVPAGPDACGDSAAAASRENAAPGESSSKNVSPEKAGAAPVAWMFAIRGRGRRVSRGEGPLANHAIGLVVVGEVLKQDLAARDGFEALANLINGFWLHVRDLEWLQLARRTDRGSGVLNRTDFLEAAEIAATEAYQEGEPVVAMAVAVEGLRRLDDDGHWAVRDRLIQETGRVLRKRLRNDDLVGRFSDDRFVVLLRWLDLSLGRLIGAKVIHALRTTVADVLRDSFPAGGKDYLNVRCGMASSRAIDDPGPPALSDLLVGALSASATARRNGQEICIAGSSDEQRTVLSASRPGNADGERPA